MDGGLTPSNIKMFCEKQRDMKAQRPIKTSKMKKVVKLLKQILAELRYMRKCRVIEMEAQSIVPPGEPPEEDDPEN